MEPGTTRPTGAAYHRPHVLILSDDTGLSAFLNEGLVLGGFWTSVIASGIQALEVFRLRTFDLVLLDAMLSGLGATELIRRLRSPDETGQRRVDIPIVVIAGNLDEIDAAEVAAAGADGTLFPPIELEELLPSLFRMIDAWRAAHPDRPWADAVAQHASDQ